MAVSGRSLLVVAGLVALLVSPGLGGLFGGDDDDDDAVDETFCPQLCRCNPGYYPVSDEWATSDNLTTSTHPPPGPPSLDCRHLDLLDFPSMNSLSKVYAHMYFSYNELSMVHSYTFMGHESLIFLDLSNNDIKHIEDSSFSNQKELGTLDISHNKLESIQAEAFYGLSQLGKLLVNNNKLVALDADVFTYMYKLEVIDLSGNQLIDQRLNPDLFRGMTWLASVSLNRMGLLGLPEDIFNDQEITLKELYMRYNSFNAIPSAAFRPVRSALEILDLSYNPITTIRTHDFANLYSLKQLELAYLPEVESIENNAFYGLSNLETLAIKFCPKLKYLSNLTFSDPIDEGDYTTMRWDGELDTLNLSYNGLRGVPGNLLPWAQIPHVDLRNNPYQCDCNMKWILSANISTNYTKLLRCFYPGWLRNRHLMEQPAYYFRCGSDWEVPLERASSGRTFRLALGITCIAITIIFLAMVVYVLQRWKVWPASRSARVCDKCLSKFPCTSWGWSKNSHLKYVTMHDIEERAKEEKDPEVYL